MITILEQSPLTTTPATGHSGATYCRWRAITVREEVSLKWACQPGFSGQSAASEHSRPARYMSIFLDRAMACIASLSFCVRIYRKPD
jgi:hypothetical protein